MKCYKVKFESKYDKRDGIQIYGEGNSITLTTSKKYNQGYIKEGDTLAQISKDNYGTVLRVKEICKLNGIENENMIHQGDMIKLPD